MVTLVVAAILVTIGVPSFSNIMRNSRATADANELVSALNFARSEATRRGVVVRVCSSTNGTVCSGATDWSTGWIVRTQTAMPEVLRVWPARSDAGVLTADVPNVRFLPRGSAFEAVAFQLRHPGCVGDQGRDIAVNVAGRVSVERAVCP